MPVPTPEQTGKRPFSLYIVGAGGFGREIYAWVQQHPRTGTGWKLEGFLDDNPDALKHFDYPHTVAGSPRDHQPKAHERFVLGVGQPHLKKALLLPLLEAGAVFSSFVHPTAVVGANVQIGQGAVLCPYSVVTSDVVLGDFVLVNVHSSIGHDASIGPWSTLSAHCDVTGGAVLGEAVFMGSHATVIPRCRIGDGAIIGAGSVVMHKVRAESTVLGIPAKRL